MADARTIVDDQGKNYFEIISPHMREIQKSAEELRNKFALLSVDELPFSPEEEQKKQALKKAQDDLFNSFEIIAGSPPHGTENDLIELFNNLNQLYMALLAYNEALKNCKPEVIEAISKNKTYQETTQKLTDFCTTAGISIQHADKAAEKQPTKQKMSFKEKLKRCAAVIGG